MRIAREIKGLVKVEIEGLGVQGEESTFSEDILICPLPSKNRVEKSRKAWKRVTGIRENFGLRNKLLQSTTKVIL